MPNLSKNQVIKMRIAITGGIGSGKTFVANYIKSKGYQVIDADRVARQLMGKGQVNYQNILEKFGADILDADGEIDRIILRDLVFHDENKRQLLNSITHPNIMKHILDNSEGEEIYFIEIPLLFEEKLDSLFDQAWVVDCSPETQVKRVVARSNLSDEEVLDIIRCQMKREDRNSKAYVVINSEQSDLYDYIDKLLMSLEKAGN